MRAKLIRGALLSALFITISRALSKASVTVSTLIVASLLSPEAFGYVAIGLATISLFDIMTQFGARDFLIQRNSYLPKLASSVFAIEICRGVGTCILIIGAASSVANWFEMPEATATIQALAFVPLIRSFTNVELVGSVRHASFGRQSLVDLSAPLAAAAITILAALSFKSHWAIIAGHLVGACAQVTTSYLVAKKPPLPSFSRRAIRIMFRFNVHMIWGAIVTYFALNAPMLIVAKLFTASDLGQFSVAMAVSSLAANEIAKPASKVVFPVYARVRQNAADFHRIFSSSYSLILAIASPISISTAILSIPLVHSILDPQWAQAGPMVFMLSIAVSCRLLTVAASGVFWAVGRPDVTGQLGLISIGTFAVLCAAYLLSTQQPKIYHIAFIFALSQFAQFAALVFALKAVVRISPTLLIKDINPIGFALIGLSVTQSAFIHAVDAPLVQLLGGAALGMLVYMSILTCAWVLFRRGPVGGMIGALRHSRPVEYGNPCITRPS